jgi:hypothetical protein
MRKFSSFFSMGVRLLVMVATAFTAVATSQAQEPHHTLQPLTLDSYNQESAFECLPAAVYCRSEGRVLPVALLPTAHSLMSPVRVAQPPAPAHDASFHLAFQTALPPDSLPENMPWNTRLFWGARGLFRGIGLAPEHRSQELALRRRMLAWHQRLGILTWGMFTAQVITGQLIYNNPAEHYENLQPVHRALGYTTWGSYLLTASLSLTAPPARLYGDGISGVKIHRYLAIIHFTGMMAQPWLGRYITKADNAEDFEQRRGLHRTVGWITYGAFSAAILSIVLPL